jgi:hypothetical protein
MLCRDSSRFIAVTTIVSRAVESSDFVSEPVDGSAARALLAAKKTIGSALISPKAQPGILCMVIPCSPNSLVFYVFPPET